MASANVQTFTDANFEAEVVKSTQPVLVDFWAEWCMPCKLLAPMIDEVAELFTGKLKVGKVDIDSDKKASLKYEITAIPTLLLFKNGQVVKKFVGLSFKKADLAAVITEVVGK